MSSSSSSAGLVLRLQSLAEGLGLDEHVVQRPQQILPAAGKGGRIQRRLTALNPAPIAFCERFLVRPQMR